MHGTYCWNFGAHRSSITVRLYSFAYNWTRGLLEASQDPGKTLFHGLVLPTAIFLLLRYFQDVDLAQAFRTPLKKYLNVVIIMFLAMVPPIYGYYDTLNQFFDTPMPWDFSKLTHRKQLMDIRDEISKEISEKLDSGTELNDNEHKAYKEEVDRILAEYPQKGYRAYLELSSLRKK